MTLLDRTIAPPTFELNEFPIAKAVGFKLKNNINLYALKYGSQEVVRVEIIFNAGNFFEDKQAQAFVTSKMMLEGTSKLSAKDISEKFAFYGASYEIFSGNDKLTISVTVLNKFLHFVLPLVKEIIVDSNFQEKNLEDIKRLTSKQLEVNMEKTSFLASGTVKQHIFGENTSYGYFINPEKINAITLADCQFHYNSRIKENNFEIVVSGQVSDSVIQEIDIVFGTDKIKLPSALAIRREFHGSGKNKIKITKAGALQNSIRIARKLFTRKHPDFLKMTVLNEILGGYFGSRLMKNIREDKGLTYGISSQMVPMIHEGYFVIGTDVKAENTALALKEIYKEIEKLKNELVSDSELDTVKNYMIGSYLSTLNSPFSLADRFKSIHFVGLDYEVYDHYIENIKKIKPIEIQRLAQKYFDDTSFVEVVVGNI